MSHITGTFLICLAVTRAAAAGENLLHNGDFEAGEGGKFTGWNVDWPPFYNKKPPRFEGGEGKPHGGKSAGSIRAEGTGGYSSFVQVIHDPPRDAASVLVEGWIQAEDGVSASLIFIFFNPQDSQCEIPIQAVLPPGSKGWTRVEVEAPIPPCATKWMLRCGVTGAGFAQFDDVSIVPSKEKLEGGQSVLAVARAKYFVVPSAADQESSISISIPFPIGGQTPLAIKVDSDPPGAVARLEVEKDRENRPLRVVLKPQGKKARIKLSAETITLLRDRPLPAGDAPLATREKIPAEFRTHLRSAPGVEAEDPQVAKIAAGLPREDLQSLAKGLTEFLKGNLKYEGGGNQSARHSIKSRAAVCTGYANVAAALLIARGVPARILACVMPEGKLQEHYIVEAWVPGPGWARLESTMAMFPWPDSRNLILRIVYSDAPRSPASVPLYFKLKGAAQGGFDGDPVDGCWQSGETLGRFFISEKDAQAIENPARRAFEAQVRKPAPGSVIRFAPKAKEVPSLSERGAKVLHLLDKRLGG